MPAELNEVAAEADERAVRSHTVDVGAVSVESGLPPPLPQPGWRDLLLAIAIIWGAEIAMAVVLAVAFAFTGVKPGAEDVAQLPGFVAATSLLSALFAAGVIWYFACRRYGLGLREGLVVRRVSRRVKVNAFLIGLVSAFAAGVCTASFSTGNSFIEKLVVKYNGPEAPPTLAATILALFVILPFFEEIYYRGFIFTILKRLVRLRWAIVITVVWFGLAHVPQLAGDWIGVPVVVTMGVIWTIQRYRHDSIVPSIVSHFTYNVSLIVFSVLAQMAVSKT